MSSDAPSRGTRVCGVLDRQFERYESDAWTVRRVAGDKLGPAFGKWMVEPERGRFLIVTTPMATPDLTLSFCDDEDELLLLLLDRATTAGGCDHFELNLGSVEPVTRARIERVFPVCLAIVQGESAGGREPAE